MKILLGEKNATINEVIEEIADDQADSVCVLDKNQLFFLNCYFIGFWSSRE